MVILPNPRVRFHRGYKKTGEYKLILGIHFIKQLNNVSLKIILKSGELNSSAHNQKP